MIKYLKHSEIDFERWDKTVSQWSGQPYALSWWLDVVSPGWEALVKDDYAAVMPLPVKRRFGLRYLVQPRFCQQLGVFGQQDVEEFLHEMPYWSYDININFRNHYEGYCFREHVNYIINKVSKFDTNAIRNIKKADKSLTYHKISPSEFISFWSSENSRFGHIYAKMLNDLLSECTKREIAILLGAYSEERLVGAIFAILTNERIILLAPVSSNEGKSLSAMFGITNKIIQENHDKVIDCEGSMIPGVARFYRGLGGHNQAYSRIWRLSWRTKK